MKKSIAIVCYSLLAVVILALATVGVAYYTKKDIYDGILSGNVELLFDRLDQTGGENSALAEYQRTLDANAQYDATASWGSEKNPYVISNVRHLYNLGELQKLGFFWNNYISANYTNGVYNNGTTMPYFLVCTPEGEPACIDGTTFGREISAIGTETYPFIGSVKGSFKTSPVPCTITDTGAAVYQSTVSAIANITVIGNPADVDVGLFGCVSYLGIEVLPTEQNPNPTFTGEVSVLSNLLLYDVTVKVDSSLWDEVTSFVGEAVHDYAYEEVANDDLDLIPHENHHIGILAGHVAYTTVEFISVYYSDDKIVAIDLYDANKEEESGDAANYLSSCGIMGFIDNLNPTVTDGNIATGSGDSNGNITYSPVGGGGSLSGDYPGYVLAQDIYTNYKYDRIENTVNNTVEYVNNQTGERILKSMYIEAKDENGNIIENQYQSLCQEWTIGDTKTNRYYFFDDVFTFALSDPEDAIMNTWDEVVYEDQTIKIGTTNLDAWSTVLYGRESFREIGMIIEPVESNIALQEAIEAKKSIFISYEDGSGNINLMNLYEPDTDDSKDGTNAVEQKYFVPSNSPALVTPGSDFIKRMLDYYKEYYDQIIAYESNPEENPIPLTQQEKVDLINDIPRKYRVENSNGEFDYNETIKKYYNLVLTYGAEGNDLTIINVGQTSGGLSMDDLTNKFSITANALTTYNFFDTNNNKATFNVNGEFYDYYDYHAEANSNNYNTYQGYYYFTYFTQGNNTNYEYHWIDFQLGVDVVLTTYANTNNNIRDVEADTAPNAIFHTSASTWRDENTYTQTLTINGTSKVCTGVVINMQEQTFYEGGTAYEGESAVNASGASVIKPADKAYAYVYKDIITGKYYYSDNDEVTEAYTVSTTVSYSGVTLYRIGTSTTDYAVLTRYPQYEFYNDAMDYYINMVKLSYENVKGKWHLFGYMGTNGIDITADRGEFYILRTAKKADAAINTNYLHKFPNSGWSEYEPSSPDAITEITQSASLIFNEDDGTCYIAYSLGTVTRYLSFEAPSEDNENTAKFLGMSSNMNDSTKLRVYSVEGKQTIAKGRVQIDPKDENVVESYNVQQYVLWPNISEENQGTTVTSAENYTYSLVSVEELGNIGWLNGNGTKLTSADLDYKFHMNKNITFGRTWSTNALLNSWGINVDWFQDIVNEGVIQAPVGSEGYAANIPQGCVAFRIDDTDKPQKIRVIAALPASEFAKGELYAEDYDKYSYYFNMYYADEASTELLDEFSMEGAVDRFLMPKSYPYAADATLADADWTRVNIGSVKRADGVNDCDSDGNLILEGTTMVTPSDTEYQCSLNGEQVLIAYEFIITNAMDPGIYILGMSGYKNAVYGENDQLISAGAFEADAGDYFPMELVYFSADGVASAGRDGSVGSQLGTIDYVYAYNKNSAGEVQMQGNKVLWTVIPVTEEYATVDGIENYTTYYPTNVVMYFDNSKVNPDGSTSQNLNFYDINDSQVRIHRYIDDTLDVVTDGKKPTASTIIFNVTAPEGDLGKTLIDSANNYKDPYIKISPHASKTDVIKDTYVATARATATTQ